MIDNQGRTSAAPSFPLRAYEFLNIELAPLADGQFFVTITATTVDDEEPQLLSQEIANDRVATIDDALSLITERVCATAQRPSRKEP